MSLENYEIALEVIDDIHCIFGITDVIELKKHIKVAISVEKQSIEAKIKENNTINMENAPNYEVFCDIVEEILHERLENDTPHGEYGGDIEDEFYWDNKTWECRYSPFWNRHDKQYYYIDNYGGNNLTVTEVAD